MRRRRSGAGSPGPRPRLGAPLQATLLQAPLQGRPGRVLLQGRSGRAGVQRCNPLLKWPGCCTLQPAGRAARDSKYHYVLTQSSFDVCKMLIS